MDTSKIVIGYRYKSPIGEFVVVKVDHERQQIWMIPLSEYEAMGYAVT